MRMVELLTAGPARVLGKESYLRESAPADVTIFSPDRAWTYRAAESPSRSRNTPFDNRNFRGGPVATIVAGKIVYQA
jgi:dihydroorotase-like cyclic amidohydrolase